MRLWSCLPALLCVWWAAGAAEVNLVADGFQFPEGPSLDARGNLYLADLGNGIIPRVAPDGARSVFADTGGTNQSTLFDSEGNLYVCHNEPGRTGILKINRAGKVSVVTLTSEGRPIRRTNDMAWGPGGRLYFTSPASNTIHPEGEIHFVEPDGTTRRFASGFAFVNGIAFDAEKRYLYAGEERAANNAGFIWRFRMAADGRAEERGKELFFAFMGKRIGFDGMKFDERGFLWVAMYSEAQLWSFSTEGKHAETIAVPGRNPTNLVFGGPDGRTAYVTANDAPSGKVFSVRMRFAGAR